MPAKVKRSFGLQEIYIYRELEREREHTIDASVPFQEKKFVDCLKPFSACSPACTNRGLHESSPYGRAFLLPIILRLKLCSLFLLQRICWLQENYRGMEK